MDLPISGFPDRCNSILDVTASDADVQPRPLMSAPATASQRRSSAAAVGLCKRSATPVSGSSIHGAAKIDSNITASPSGCILSLSKVEKSNIRKLKLLELEDLKSAIDELGVTEATMSPALIQQLTTFTNKILQLELPLYRPEIHRLLAYVNNIAGECSGSDQPDFWSIKSSLAKIVHAYPGFLTSHRPGVFQLADHLLAHGFLKDMESTLISNYGVRKFVLEMTGHDPVPPVSRFIQHTMPLMKNRQYTQLLIDEPGLFFDNNCDDYFDYWNLFIELHYSSFHADLRDKVFADVDRWYKLPDAFFITNMARCKQFITAQLDLFCQGSTASFEQSLMSRCPVMKALHQLIDRPGLKAILTDVLMDYFASLTEQQRPFFSVLCFVNAPALFERLFDTPSGFSLLQSAVGWRSSDNRTVFHCGLDNMDLLTVISEGLLELVTDCYPEVLKVRDDEGRTVLESFFYFRGYFPQSTDVSGLQRLVEGAVDGGIEPCHLVALLNRVYWSEGFHAWLAMHILGKPSLIRGGLESITSTSLVNDFVQDFFRAVVSEQGEALLHKLRPLPFGSKARITLAQYFPVHLRPLLFADPFSPGSWSAWSSEVMPFEFQPVSCSMAMVELPWSDFLREAKACFSAPARPALLDQWQHYQTIPAADELPLFTQVLPSGPSGVYGRSCFFHDPHSATTLRLKLRKKMAGGEAESWDEMACEPGKLRCLRAWQANGVLALQTRFPKPLGLFRINDFQRWLTDSPLSHEHQQALREAVTIENDGAVLAYAYQTEMHEHYHHYPYETEGEGLSVELSLESLQIAANDLGLLLGCGLAATVLPMYHADQRFFVLLSQLIGYPCPGVLGSWNHEASNYPNVSPAVGIRDYADIMPLTATPIALNRIAEETPENRQIMNMEQIAREYFSLILLLPRVLERELDYQNRDFVVRLQRIINRMSCTFFAGALGLAEDTISECLETFGVTEELARVISFWCETGEHPRWVDHFRSARLPEEVYPKSSPGHIHIDSELALTVTDRGFYKTTHSQGLNLGPPNGIFPLLPLNKLLTMVFNLYVHKSTART